MNSFRGLAAIIYSGISDVQEVQSEAACHVDDGKNEMYLVVEVIVYHFVHSLRWWPSETMKEGGVNVH